MARNHGVALSNSPWIGFCDADDVWHPSKISICQRVIQEFPTTLFVFHDFYIFDDSKVIAESGTFSKATLFPIFLENRISIRDILTSSKMLSLEREQYPDANTMEVLSGNAFKGLILGNFIIPSSVIIRRDIFMEHGGFDCEFSSAEKTEFFLRISRSTDFIFVNLPLAGYRKAPGSLTSNKLSLLQNSMKALIKNCIQDAEVCQRWRDTVRKALSQRHSRISYFFLSEFKRADAIRSALKALRYNQLDKRAWLCLSGAIMPIFFLKCLVNLKGSWWKKGGR